MINVTKTYLPPFEEYAELLKKVWDSHWITNNGPLVLELEQKLRGFLGVKHLFLVSNGTIAIQVAVKALGLTKEIITTPFSYVASTSAFMWEGCRPVFVDIDPDTYDIDPAKIEAAITSNTEAILAVHVYGNPCKCEAIEAIARKHNLRVIYDAAHAFGVQYNGQSVLNFGDISTLSLHATKIFHTAEGGAIVTNDDAIAAKIAALRNFGQTGPDQFTQVGINAKLSELHAAMGLCLLPRVPEFIATRKTLSALYDSLFAGSSLRTLKIDAGVTFNYAYYPVLFDSEQALVKAMDHLRVHDIIPRRYFYPALNLLPYVPQQHLPVAEDISRRILCLPLFVELKPEQVREIVMRVLEARS